MPQPSPRPRSSSQSPPGRPPSNARFNLKSSVPLMLRGLWWPVLRLSKPEVLISLLISNVPKTSWLIRNTVGLASALKPRRKAGMLWAADLCPSQTIDLSIIDAPYRIFPPTSTFLAIKNPQFHLPIPIQLIILQKMLNFLQNRSDQAKPTVTGISRKPALAFGISADTPTEFVKHHTIVNPHSNANPHYKYQELRLAKMSGMQRTRLSGDWTQKVNINLVEEEKVVNRNSEVEERNRGLYQDLYRQELAKGSSRFRLTKGEFTNFLHNQRKNQILGPLEGQERTLERARQTRKSILQQSITSLQKLKSNPSLLSTHRTSTIWVQKRKLRKSRQDLHKSIKVQLQSRRYNKSPDFLLPKVRRSSIPKNHHRPTQSQYLCENYLNQYFKTVDVANTTRN